MVRFVGFFVVLERVLAGGVAFHSFKSEMVLSEAEKSSQL